MGMMPALVPSPALCQARFCIALVSLRQRLLAKVIQNVKKLNTSGIILSGFGGKVCHAVKHVFAAGFRICVVTQCFTIFNSFVSMTVA